ncbi:universal stress protein [Myceligenerans sp. TRM 65318]|uniref:Universal stress protein n=2 Tax=Myceligenerans pegani TaxID=2776917 RepID=A0ABR9N2U4_9MICO|nr:universal stress protein [Myceligenerans sp. TRM 65318]MBE3020234.1 universal stress protein [Myceligenerans sp. TRM 65318]
MTMRSVVVGVDHRQPDLPRRAASLVQSLGGSLVEIVCLWVDETAVTEPNGFAVSVDPDIVVSDDRYAADVLDGLNRSMADVGLPWSAVRGAGDPARELARVADEVSAAMIVIGARRAGLRGWATSMVGGTVAGHLVHDQRRPVVVLPEHPLGGEEPA